jgi:hypothetical protein
MIKTNRLRAAGALLMAVTLALAPVAAQAQRGGHGGGFHGGGGGGYHGGGGRGGYRGGGGRGIGVGGALLGLGIGAVVGGALASQYAAPPPGAYYPPQPGYAYAPPPGAYYPY